MELFSAKTAFNDIRNFLAGRFVGATRDEFFLEEIIKLVFCKYEINGLPTTEFEDIELSGIYRKTFKTVIEKYPDIYSATECELEFDPLSIKYIDTALNGIDLIGIERDIIGDAYEIFMGDVIKGQSGQFFTPQNAANALVKMIAPKSNENVLDLACGAGGFLVSTIKHVYASTPSIDVPTYVKNHIFGIDKDRYLSRLAKIHIACMARASANITCADSLVWDKNLLGDEENTFDIILTNPPFGTNINTGTVETLSKFQLAHKYKRDSKKSEMVITDEINESVPPQVVFLEQCVRVVKPGGRIGIVAPESMVSNKKYSFVNDFIMRFCNIKAIIGMPDELFKTSGKGGTHTKTCLLVLEKKKSNKEKNGAIFMAEAKWCGHDSRGREIPNDDIPSITSAYLQSQDGSDFEESAHGFLLPLSKLDNNVLAPRCYTQSIEQKHQELSGTHDFVSIGEMMQEGILQVTTGNEIGKLSYGTGDIPFIRTSDISNWEIKSDPKQLVSQDVYDKLSEKQDVQEGDILMVKDGTYLIGTCAMVTKYDVKMLYQSHIYKLRLKTPNKHGIDGFYLLAALSSDLVKGQIYSKTLSQDIINSLGDRLKELHVPISKNKERVTQISRMVKKSIDDRVEARELARKARSEVLM